MKVIAFISIMCFLTMHLIAQDMRNYIDEDLGFYLSYPSDWTVKKAITETIAFKAVKRFSDGQYLMITINTLLLERSDYSMSDFSIEEMTNLVIDMFGAQNVGIISSFRDKIGNLPSIKMLLDSRPPNVKPRIEYSTFVIRGSFLYDITVSCNKPLYKHYGELIKKISDSFNFISSKDDGTSGRIEKETYENENHNRTVITNQEETLLSAFLKSFFDVWLKYTIMAILLFIGSLVWAKIKTKNSTD